MNVRKSVITALAVLSLVVIPTIAQAAPAQTSAAAKLSVRDASAVRQGVRVSKANKQEGGSSGIIIAVLAAAAVVAGIVVAADGSSAPRSP